MATSGLTPPTYKAYQAYQAYLSTSSQAAYLTLDPRLLLGLRPEQAGRRQSGDWGLPSINNQYSVSSIQYPVHKPTFVHARTPGFPPDTLRLGAGSGSESPAACGLHTRHRRMVALSLSCAHSGMLRARIWMLDARMLGCSDGGAT